MNHENSQEQRAHLADIVRDVGTAMLLTRRGIRWHARPMAVAKAGFADSQRDGRDDTLYFSTGADTSKVEEIEQDPTCTLTLQSERAFAVIHGQAEILNDRALVDRLWSEAWKVWFPQGKEDPNIRIVRVIPREAEYWDIRGTKGLRYLFDTAKALVSGERPGHEADQNAKLDLHS